VELIANLGLGFLFLLAGYELEPHLLRERAGTLAIVAWVTSIGLSLAVVGLLASQGYVRAFVPVAIGLTTTALGTLLPILRERGLDRGAFGRYVFAAGAIGELGPVLAIALLLGAHGSIVEVFAVAAVAGVALALSVVPRLLRGGRIEAIVARGEHETQQTTLRITVLLLVLLLYLSSRFGLDVVLGAFFAGMVLRRWHPGDVASLERKLDAIGYGFFIPVFFVASGMGLDIDSIAAAPGRMLAFFMLLLAVRGVPALLVYRRELLLARRVQLMLLTATALPLLVALAHIGLENGTMLPENAAALVGAGVLSIAVFPQVAVALQRRALAEEGTAESAESDQA
jgi:Kef-type K+ transport system membrane component KefB